MRRTRQIRDMRMLLCVIAASLVYGMTLTSCEEEQKHYVKNIGDGEGTPTMNTLNVNTFISDSGYTKYYITSPLWSIFDEAKEPFWLFPKGVELEQYDNKLKPVASMRCDSAKYLSQKRLWRLDGNVVMVNTNRDTFLTQQLYWDQAKREIHTDSFIHIVRQQRIIEGYGFVSNERMTSYTIKKPMGIFPVDHRPGDNAPKPVDDDSLHSGEMYRGYAPPRASTRSSRMSAPPMQHDTVPRSMQSPMKVNGPIKIK